MVSKRSQVGGVLSDEEQHNYLKYYRRILYDGKKTAASSPLWQAQTRSN